jgi:8-oxo-dGTP pyrophosphatase MutT (NUDIX family)
MIGFEVLAYGRYMPETIETVYRQDASIHWENEVDAHISRVWELYVKMSRESGLSVYNGSLFRLDHSEAEDGILRLDVSDVDFRSYIGTALPGFVAAFPGVARANPLAVCVVLVTSDEKIVMDRRAKVDAYRGRYHVIAGFMEKNADIIHDRPDPFGALRREVREELGILLEHGVRCTGLVRTAMGSELCFSCPLDITFEGLLSTKAGSRTDAEIDELFALPDSPASILSFLTDHRPHVVPSGMACLLLHGRNRHGEVWYDRAIGALSRRSGR